MCDSATLHKEEKIEDRILKKMLEAIESSVDEAQELAILVEAYRLFKDAIKNPGVVMTTIFAVSSHYDYEGNGVVAVFSTEELANEFKDIVEEYHALAPVRPPASNWNDEELWEKYSIENKKWEENHPAGTKHADADSFFIEEIPFNPTQE